MNNHGRISSGATETFSQHPATFSHYFTEVPTVGVDAATVSPGQQQARGIGEGAYTKYADRQAHGTAKTRQTRGR